MPYEKANTSKPLVNQGVSVFLGHFSEFTFRGKQFPIFPVLPDLNQYSHEGRICVEADIELIVISKDDDAKRAKWRKVPSHTHRYYMIRR